MKITNTTVNDPVWILDPTHSHNGLSHSGEHGWPQRVQQNLALQQDKVQQRGAVLCTQIHQQSAVVSPADKKEERTFIVIVQ